MVLELINRISISQPKAETTQTNFQNTKSVHRSKKFKFKNGAILLKLPKLTKTTKTTSVISLVAPHRI